MFMNTWLEAIKLGPSQSKCPVNEVSITQDGTCQNHAMAHSTSYLVCEVYIKLYNMNENQTFILMYKLGPKMKEFEIY